MLNTPETALLVRRWTGFLSSTAESIFDKGADATSLDMVVGGAWGYLYE